MGPCVRDVDVVGGPRGPSVGVWESVGLEKVWKLFGKVGIIRKECGQVRKSLVLHCCHSKQMVGQIVGNFQLKCQGQFGQL